MANEKAEKAEKTEKTEKTVTPRPAPAPAPKQVRESVYSAQELVANYKTFGVPKEIVTVALRQAGKPVYTFPEAKRIVETFSKKEV